MTLTFCMKPDDSLRQLTCPDCKHTQRGEGPRYGGRIVCPKCGGLMDTARKAEEGREMGTALERAVEAAKAVPE